MPAVVGRHPIAQGVSVFPVVGERSLILLVAHISKKKNNDETLVGLAFVAGELSCFFFVWVGWMDKIFSTSSSPTKVIFFLTPKNAQKHSFVM